MKSSITVGMDMGDKKHQVCVLDCDGNEERMETISNTSEGIKKFFKYYAGATVAIEAGTHSGWVSRVLESMGCNVLIGNPRKLKAIWQSTNKSDIRDAEMLARIARFDRKLLYPIHHRGEQAQMALETIKARDMLVRNRSDLINHVRSAVKSVGARIPACSAESFHHRAAGTIPQGLETALNPLLTVIEDLSGRIRIYDKDIEELSARDYPETGRLRQIAGVGPVTALAYVLTLEEASRFKKSRMVGPFLGLTQRRDQSGEVDKQLRISKAGNEYLRRLLVGCSHYILGPFGPDSDLRRYGMRIAERGGKNAKRRAVVAVARKLAVLLHRLWVCGETYEPLRISNAQRAA
jgi:transposase